MTPEEGPPDVPDLADEWRAQWEGAPTRERVYAVALQLYEPTRVRDVADRADVSKETAREYLKWFAELGVVDQVEESPDAFQRNEGYFAWRRIQRLLSLSEEERSSRMEALTRAEREYRERFDAADPADVDAMEQADYDEVESVWLAIDEWRTVRRRIRELERARQIQDEASRASA